MANLDLEHYKALLKALNDVTVLATFIAEAPTMVQALVERVEELERQAKAKDEALKQIAGLRPDISDRSAAIEIAQNALKSSEVQG